MWNLRLPARILVMNSEHVPEASYRRVSHVNANSKYKLHRFVLGIAWLPVSVLRLFAIKPLKFAATSALGTAATRKPWARRFGLWSPTVYFYYPRCLLRQCNRNGPNVFVLLSPAPKCAAHDVLQPSRVFPLPGRHPPETSRKSNLA